MRYAMPAVNGVQYYVAGAGTTFHFISCTGLDWTGLDWTGPDTDPSSHRLFSPHCSYSSSSCTTLSPLLFSYSFRVLFCHSDILIYLYHSLLWLLLFLLLVSPFRKRKLGLVGDCDCGCCCCLLLWRRRSKRRCVGRREWECCDPSRRKRKVQHTSLSLSLSLLFFHHVAPGMIVHWFLFETFVFSSVLVFMNETFTISIHLEKPPLRTTIRKKFVCFWNLHPKTCWPRGVNKT